LPIAFTTARSAPRDVEVVGVPVFTDGPVPRSAGVGRKALAALGFEGKVGQTAVVPQAGGPDVVVVGMGEPGQATAATLRSAAAALARASAKRISLATGLTQATDLPPAAAAQAIAEGVVLAAYRYVALKSDQSSASALERVVLLTDPARAKAVGDGAERGQAIADAVTFARDLINAPPAYLTARQLGEVARQTAEERGLAVEVFEEDAIAELGLGGLLAVNRGSVEPPRLVKLTYAPRNPQGAIALVGKGITYDSGGISLKPSDAMHAIMKMDMSGAAAVLATLSVLPVLKPRVKVVGYLCCTDNMPSGSAFKLGDVITIRNGTTVEIHNTDAEGRLVLADGLSLAKEEQPDAVLDIATLTGAVMNALGLKIAGVMGNDDGLVAQVKAASDATDEKVWPLPLPPEYRKLLDSDIADLKNVGGPYAGALTAGLFLKEFVGDLPWAHLDIAGVMRSENDDGWLAKGGTAFGVRLLTELVCSFRKPA
jgi:leucyl aminopeptidase